MEQLLMSKLAWLGPWGLIALTLGLRWLRKFIKTAGREAKSAGTYAKPAVEITQEFGDRSDFADDDQAARAYGFPKPEAAPPPNPVEEHYRKTGRTLVDAEKEVQLAQQLAQHNVVARNAPQLLTIYDPADVKAGDPLTRLEDFPHDDIRRQPGSNHPAAGELGDVVVLDFRLLADEFDSAPPFRDRYAAKVKARQEAIKGGAMTGIARPADGSTGFRVVSADEVIDRDIVLSKRRSAENRLKARQDFIALLPEIRTEAERLARDVMVPARMEEITREAGEKGVSVDTVVDAYVLWVGQTAVERAEAQFSSRPDLNDPETRKRVTGTLLRSDPPAPWVQKTS
jgi:hypothetical protein